MKRKFNIKIFFSVSLFIFFTYSLILIFYIKNNMNVYIPPKEHEEHLGIFSGVSNDLVDNSLNFRPSSIWLKKYKISPISGEAVGPLQIYHISVFF